VVSLIPYTPHPQQKHAVAAVVAVIVLRARVPGRKNLSQEYSRKPKNLLIVSMANLCKSSSAYAKERML
jgi:hypothetical protein